MPQIRVLGVSFDPKIHIGNLLPGVDRSPLRFTSNLSMAGRCPLRASDNMAGGRAGRVTTRPLAGWSTGKSAGKGTQSSLMYEDQKVSGEGLAHFSGTHTVPLTAGSLQFQGCQPSGRPTLDNFLVLGLRLYLGNRLV